MAKEIEMKFTVTENELPELTNGKHIVQGYFHTAGKGAIRIRIVDNEKAYLTIKSQRKGISCDEYEYEIPLKDAKEMMATLVSYKVEKMRYIIEFRGQNFEVDVFLGDNKGLILAELELKSNGDEKNVILPLWVNNDVSNHYRFTNLYLAKHPINRINL